MATATIKVGINQDAGREDMYDFTPEDRKVYARSLKVAKGRFHVHISETDRLDPSRAALYVLVGNRGLGEQGEISIDATARDLNDMIETLTLARDTAINEWMMEPAL